MNAEIKRARQDVAERRAASVVAVSGWLQSLQSRSNTSGGASCGQAHRLRAPHTVTALGQCEHGHWAPAYADVPDPTIGQLWDVVYALQDLQHQGEEAAARQEVVDRLATDAVIIKAAPLGDEYVAWSQADRIPLGVWDRGALLAHGVTEERLAYTDEWGSSSRLGIGRWGRQGLVVGQHWWVARDDLMELARMWLDCRAASVEELLEERPYAPVQWQEAFLGAKEDRDNR